MTGNQPRSRQDLVVQELDGELLVYDELSKKALCLNGTSATIWKMCDGKTSVAQMAERASRSLALPIDEACVTFALERLSNDGLMESVFEIPAGAERLTRAQLMQRFSKVGIAAAAAIPLIAIVAAPTAAKAYGVTFDHSVKGEY